MRTYLRDIEPVIAMRPDALIMADPGLIMLVRENWPEQCHPPLGAGQHRQLGHGEVLAEAWAWRASSCRASCSLDEIEKIRQECPDMELEVFVHGALCIAYSGRCLLSGYFNRRDPNQGTCTNACRWEYKTHEGMDATTPGEVHGHQPMDRRFNFEAARKRR